MQINSITNTNFGLKFSNRMNDFFNRGKREEQLKHPQNENIPAIWTREQADIKNKLNDNFTLEIEKHGNKNNIVIIDNFEKKPNYDIWTLPSDEKLGFVHLKIIKNKLTELEGILQNDWLGLKRPSSHLQFSENFYKLLNESRQNIIKRNPNAKILKAWKTQKDIIKELYNNNFMIDVDYNDNGNKNIVLIDSKKEKHDLMTLHNDEILDKPYLIVLKNKLKGLRPSIAQ